MKAWLITWIGTSKKITDDNRIVGIISSRRSSQFIEELTDSLYQMNTETAYGMSFYMNRKKERYNRTRNMTHKIIFGSNPFLYARIVDDLKISRNHDDFTETVSWTEQAEYEQDPEDGYRIKMVEEPKSVTVVRNIHNALLPGRPIA